MLEQLEARIVLSGTYYAWTGVDTLPGYDAEYGVADTITGASDDGRFMWSEAAADPTDPGETHEPYLVVDGLVRYLRDIPALADSAIAGVNSHGVAFARDIEGEDEGRQFLLDLLGTAGREYLDAGQLDAPSDFDLAVMNPMAITDAGGLVLGGASDVGVQLWVIVDGHVTKLWSGNSSTVLVDVNASNGVVGHQGNNTGNAETPLMWTPESGLTDLDEQGVRQVGALDNNGWLFGMKVVGEQLEAVLWRGDEVRETGFTDNLGITYHAEDADASGRIIVSFMLTDNRDDVLHYRLQAFDGEVRIMSDDGQIEAGYDLTESGVLLDRGTTAHAADGPAGGWYRVLTGEELVRSVAGESAAVWNSRDGLTVIGYRDSFGGVTRFTLDAAGELDWGVSVTPFRFGDGTPLRAFVDPTTGASVSLLVTGGHLREIQVNQGMGLGGPMDADTGVFGSIDHNPVAFFLPGGNPVYGGFDQNERLRLAYHIINGPSVDADLSAHLDTRGLDTPAFASDLEAFRTPWGAMNIVGLDADGDLHAVWWSPGLGSPLWTTTNLSALTGAPKLVGNITASATKWNGMQVFGTDERGHAIALWWSPTSGGWQWDDLTAEAAGEALVPGSLTGAATRWGAIELVGRTADDQVATYWWAPGQQAWTYESITLQQSGSTPRITGPVSLALGPDGSQHIAGVSAAGEVIHLFWLPDGQDLWRGENLTALAAG